MNKTKLREIERQLRRNDIKVLQDFTDWGVSTPTPKLIGSLAKGTLHVKRRKVK